MPVSHSALLVAGARSVAADYVSSSAELYRFAWRSSRARFGFAHVSPTSTSASAVRRYLTGIPRPADAGRPGIRNGDIPDFAITGF